MTWFRIDDGLFEHPKWVRALAHGGPMALQLWLRLGTWSARYLTDGEVPVDVVRQFVGARPSKALARAWQALAEASLITPRACGGCSLVDFLQYQPSRADTLANRGRKAQNQQDHRGRENVTGDTLDQPVTLSPRPVPSRPDPVLIPKGEGETRAGVAKTYTMPGPVPPKDYLDVALMGGVSAEQAKSTWKHYFGAGLPQGGVERLHDWLTQRASERQAQLARLPGARQGPNQPNAGKTGLEIFQRKAG